MTIAQRLEAIFVPGDGGLDELTIEQKEMLLGYALILPAVLLVFGIILYPILYNFYLSFHEVPLSPVESPEWLGLEHYRDLLTNEDFWRALRNTVIFTFFSDLLALVLGLFAALLLNREFKGRSLARGLVLLPYITPIIAVAFLWRWMFNPLFGVIPYSLQQTGVITGTIDVLGTSELAIWGAIVFDGWRYFPFAFLLIIARVQAIPGEMYEAARIDGAGRLAQFKDITLPELKYILATVFLIRWIWNFNKFADVWLLTHQVTTLPIFTYQSAFASFELGVAAAIAVILFVLQLAFVFLYVTWAMEW